jgi:adenylate kinase
LVGQTGSRSGVILIEADASTVASRLQERDGESVDRLNLENFIVAERLHAQKVCAELNIPLKILYNASLQDFIGAINTIS